MPRALKIAELRAMTDDELVALHAKAAPGTGSGVLYYLADSTAARFVAEQTLWSG